MPNPPQDGGGRPAVSIVLTTFRRPGLLREAIESCLAQTWRDLELIVIDDGSGDDTPRVVEEYVAQDSRVRLLVQERNGGQCRALNRAFGCARGDFLTWTSDDNRYHPTAIERMLAALRSGSADIVFADFENVGQNGRQLSVVKLAAPDPGTLYVCLGACFLYRREVHKDVGDWDEGLSRSPDLDYWIRARKLFRLEHLPEVLYSNSHHEAAVTTAQFPELCVENAIVLRRHARSSDEGRREFARWHSRASLEAEKVGLIGSSLRYGLVAAWHGAEHRRDLAERLYRHLCPPIFKALYRALRPGRPQDGL